MATSPIPDATADQVTDSAPAIALGHIVIALALAGLGVLGLVYDDFALSWQAVPQGLPWRPALAYLSAIIMLAGGIGLFVKPIAVRCAGVVTIYLILCWVLPQALKAVPAPFSVGTWLGFFETSAVTAGAWLLCVSLRRSEQINQTAPGPVLQRSVPIAQRLFGAACIVFGISHFAYANFTAGMIPPWLPFRLPLAYATGIGHAAAGLGILLGIRPRLAATLEALMMSSFVVLLHVPSLWAAPPPDWAQTPQVQWTALFWASALAASAWIVAGSLRDRPWAAHANA
jgi:uncharacterized membrane protein